MREISILKQRILYFLEKTGVSKYECYKNTGITNGVLSQSNGMSEDNLLKFLSYYSNINHTWLLTGQGEMLLTDQTSASVVQPKDESLIYTMYKEEKAENKVLTKEIGALEQQVKTLEKQLEDLGFGQSNKQEASAGSTLTRKGDAVGLENALFVEQP